MPGADAQIAEYLQPFQNPLCWSGWRLIVRRLEDWDAATSIKKA
jgi:hypothetical protein